MKKKSVRIVLDVLLTVMVVAEMFIQYTGNFLHEVIGFAFFATVAIHLLLSAKWMKNTTRAALEGKLSGRRIALAVMASLLAVAMLVLGVSSVAISDILASAGLTWTLGSYAMWVTIHSLSSYTLCALVVIHLAMHWVFLASSFKVPYNPERRRAIGVGVNTVAAIGAVALGVTAVRSALPQTVAQAVASEETSQTSSETMLENVSDVPYKGKKNSSRSGAASSSAKPSSGSPSSSSAAPSDSSFDEPVAPSQAQTVDESSIPSDTSGSDSFFDLGPSSSENSTSTASGICTLCRKQCSLSNPRCDKPYAAGLI